MTEDTLASKVRRRQKALWAERSSYDSHAQEIADFLLPRGARIGNSERNRGGQSSWSRIIDETGTLAHGTLESGLMAGLTSPARPWVKLATPDRDLMEFGPVKLWLSKTTAKMLQIFSKSNTYRAFRGTYGQLGAFGIGANVVVDNYDNVLHNYPLVFGQYAVGLNHLGAADTVCRRMTKTVSQLVEQFGIDNVSQTVKNLYDQRSYDSEVDVVHLIEPRRKREAGKRDAKNMRFRSVYVEEGRDGDGVLQESGFDAFPAVCPRWLVDGDDTYASRWPAAMALGSIKQLQQEQLKKSTAIDYQVDPPLAIPMTMKSSNVDRFPGGYTFVDMSNPQGGIRSMYEVNLNLQHLLLDIQDVRQRINQAFFVDLFKMLANDTRSNITAREIAERHEEKLLMLGPVLESLHNEMLQPYVEITFAKMVKAGLFAPGTELSPPQELNGKQLDVEFISTLAQAQRAVGASGIDRLIGTIGSLSTMKPDVLDKLDADQAVDLYADTWGVDPSIIVSDDKVALIRQQRAEQQASMQAAAMAAPMKDMAQAAQAASETDPQGLSGVMSAFSGYGIPGMPGAPR